LSDQFALGDGMIVAPVVEPGATTRELYLPEGDWYHLWTGDIYSGPIRLTVDAPIGEPPVFTREDRPDLRALP
jgi:alpha-glucosidase